MAGITVLYDGWSLVYAPISPESLHLFEILSALPEEVNAVIALPGAAPAWLPEHAQPYLVPTSPTQNARLAWEQRILPGLQRRLRAEILHLTSSHAPLFASGPVVVSPGDILNMPRSHGFTGRLREAFSAGGMARLSTLLWPADLPWLDNEISPTTLPPVTGDLAGSAASGISYDLPDAFILYHGPSGDSDIRRVLDAWIWAAGPIGDQSPLLFAGFSNLTKGNLQRYLDQYQRMDTIRILPPLQPTDLPQLYSGCSAFFYPAAISPWGNPLRTALTYGRPIIASEGQMVESLVGPAAYLVEAGDTRAMGAALITVMIENSVSEELSQAALQRAAAWDSGMFSSALLSAYHGLL